MLQGIEGAVTRLYCFHIFKSKCLHLPIHPNSATWGKQRSCRTRESGLCTSSGQHSRADPVGRGLGKPSLLLWAWESCPHYSSVMWWDGQGKDTPHHHHHLCPRQVEELAPTLCLGNTAELALKVLVLKDWPWGSECQRTVLITQR